MEITMKSHCPVLQSAEQVRKSGDNLLRSMRRLRRSLNACQACPQQNECSFRLSFNTQVDAVIAELNEEWGLTDLRLSDEG
jgi:hypothetical protein